MNAALTLSLALLFPLVACAADGGRIHAPPPQSGADAPDDHADDADSPVVSYDEPFPLRFGAAVTIERGDTRARFAEVVEDSRCPLGVQCVQAGRARVRLEVRRGGAEPVSIELATDPEASLASAGGVTWELREVEPYPAAGRERPAADYVLTLVAHPLRSR